jgi:hypothetical protein
MGIVLAIGVVLGIAVMFVGTLINVPAFWHWYRREMLPGLSQAPARRVALATAGAVSCIAAVMGVLIWQPLGDDTIVVVIGFFVVWLLGWGMLSAVVQGRAAGKRAREQRLRRSPSR